MSSRLAGKAAFGTAVVGGLLLVWTSPVAAHSADPGPATNYRSVVMRLEPAVPDLEFRVIDLGARVSLTVHGPHTVVVMGYEGEPFLRVDRRGVWQNMRSPATYLNRDRYARTPIPPDADATAPPLWHRMSNGHIARWHDHRTHWMATRPPPAVSAHPQLPRSIIDPWTIPLRVDGSPATVVGRLTWEPAPARWPWLWGMTACALLAAATALWGQAALVVSAGLAAGATTVHALGIVVGSDRSLWQFGVVIVLPSLAVGLSAGAGLALGRSRVAAVALASGALIAVLLVAGRSLGELNHSQLPGQLSGSVARFFITASVGMGVGGLLGSSSFAVLSMDVDASSPSGAATA
jgi:hypothetical protein